MELSKRYFPILILFILLTAGCKSLKHTERGYSNFSDNQLSLIRSGGDTTPMRLYLTTNKSDSLLLRINSMPVDLSQPDPDLNLFIKRLHTTVRDSLSLGVGIAAPQVGILKNIIWVQRFDKKDFPFEVYINPVITRYSDKKQDCREGCLSIPNKQAITKTRAFEIDLEYDKQDGTHHKETISDFTAVIFQHEIDHLHGKLFIDHLKEE